MRFRKTCGTAAALLLLALAGCRTARPVALPAALPLPESPTAATDSLSRASVHWRAYFTDAPLQTLLDAALRRNPDLKANLQQILLAQANLLLANGALWPTVAAAASAAGDRYGEYTLNGIGNFDTNLSPNIDKDHRIPVSPTTDFFLGLRSSWEVDIWGKLRDRREGARKRYAASSQAQLWFRTQIVAQVAGLYYELLALDNQLTVLARNLELQEQALELVRAQLEGGRATLLAVQQFRAQVLNTQSRQAVTRQQLAARENELNALLGRYPETVGRDSTLTALPLPAGLLRGVPTGLLLNRPDIVEAELELAATQAEVSAARKAFFPSLTLTAYTGLSAFRPRQFADPGSIVYGLLGGLTAPVLNRSFLRSSFAVANAVQVQAFYRYQQRVLQGYREVLTSLQHMDNYRQAYASKSGEVDTLRMAVESANELYRNGYATYLEVITAQRNVLDAELEQADLKKQIFLGSVDLYRALGGG